MKEISDELAWIYDNKESMDPKLFESENSRLLSEFELVKKQRYQAMQEKRLHLR